MKGERSQFGFSMLEMLLVVSIIGILAGSGFSAIRKARIEADMKNSMSSLVHAIEESGSRSRTGTGSDVHGLVIKKDRIIMFEGSTYSGTGEEIYFSPRITSNLAEEEIIFSRISGEPNKNTTITLTHSSGKTEDVVLTSRGIVLSE